jgi:hypothetical protein
VSTNSLQLISKVFIYLNNRFPSSLGSIYLGKLVLSTQAFIFDFGEEWQKTAVAGDHSKHPGWGKIRDIAYRYGIDT